MYTHLDFLEFKCLNLGKINNIFKHYFNIDVIHNWDRQNNYRWWYVGN